jgi:hypothetical protein
MDVLYIFMNHICPAAGAVIALLMFMAPLKAVLQSNRSKELGVRTKSSARAFCMVI